jgi:branched-chain amino acid transport system permease protein
MSIDLLAGYTGLAPLGHAGIFGVSAYTVGYLIARADASAAIAIPAGIIVATLVTAVFALLAIRTTGVYFLMVTLAEGMLIWGIAYRWASVTGAENGIRGIDRPVFFSQYWQFYYVVLIVCIVTAALMYRFAHSPFGLTLQGIRESATRMETLGYNVLLHKFIGFVASGFFASIAGMLYAFHNRFVSPSTVEFARSAEGLLMVIVGGTGTLFGALLGSAIVIFTRNIVSLYTDRWPMVMGFIFVVIILFARKGLVDSARRLLHRVEQARSRDEAAGAEVGGTTSVTAPPPSNRSL